MGPPHVTEGLSKVLKNTSKRGKECEQRALESYLKRGYKLLAQRYRTPFAEIDLILQKKKEILMVEVKSVRNREDYISHQQTRRLQRAHLYLSHRYPQWDFLLQLVLVDSQNKLHCIQEW